MTFNGLEMRGNWRLTTCLKFPVGARTLLVTHMNDNCHGDFQHDTQLNIVQNDTKPRSVDGINDSGSCVWSRTTRVATFCWCCFCNKCRSRRRCTSQRFLRFSSTSDFWCRFRKILSFRFWNIFTNSSLVISSAMPYYQPEYKLPPIKDQCQTNRITILANAKPWHIWLSIPIKG